MSKGITRRGSVLVVSGPSGAGKSTVTERVLQMTDNLHFSISCTTRQPRPSEAHGREYFFITTEEYERLVEANDFLEHANVHGNCYGTLVSEVRNYIEAGVDVLLDIDVQGGMQIRQRCASEPYWRDAVSFIFIGPPSFATLELRLRGRGTEEEAVIQRRLQNARHEMERWDAYDYLIINDTIDEAVAALQAIVTAERCRIHRLSQPSPWTDI